MKTSILLTRPLSNDLDSFSAFPLQSRLRALCGSIQYRKQGPILRNYVPRNEQSIAVTLTYHVHVSVNAPIL